MKLVIKSVNSEDKDGRIEKLEINGEHKLSVSDLWDCPEDAIIGRGIVSINEIVNLMHQAYIAGKNGEEWDCSSIEFEDYDSFWEDED